MPQVIDRSIIPRGGKINAFLSYIIALFFIFIIELWVALIISGKVYYQPCCLFNLFPCKIIRVPNKEVLQ